MLIHDTPYYLAICHLSFTSKVACSVVSPAISDGPSAFVSGACRREAIGIRHSAIGISSPLAHLLRLDAVPTGI